MSPLEEEQEHGILETRMLMLQKKPNNLTNLILPEIFTLWK